LLQIRKENGVTKPLKLIRYPSAGPAKPPALAARKVSKVFHVEQGFSTVLSDLHFDIHAGELVCILGPSGCGKTTVLNLIAGFERPSSGQLSIDGRRIDKPGPDRCVVFQENALFPWLTVAENIAFGAKRILPGKQLAPEVERYLEMVGLKAFKGYLPRDISGGMKQRVALARVLILKPKVLLMDEPFGALDAQTREEMQNLLLRLWQTLSHTIVFVTHDLGEAVTLADRILLMGRDSGCIQLDIPVPLPRPRKSESDAFHRFYRELRSHF
jgi:NitT/TauT family transport system ATP-binding protein